MSLSPIPVGIGPECLRSVIPNPRARPRIIWYRVAQKEKIISFKKKKIEKMIILKSHQIVSVTF